MMEKKLQVQVFGKAGCDKCKILNQRLDKLLGSDEWSGFEKKYFDVETEDGMICFSNAECINPQRIPAILVAAWDENAGVYKPVPNVRPDQKDEVCAKSKLYQYLGLQTDYSEAGKGLISPRMIKSVLSEARS